MSPGLYALETTLGFAGAELSHAHAHWLQSSGLPTSPAVLQDDDPPLVCGSLIFRRNELYLRARVATGQFRQAPGFAGSTLLMVILPAWRHASTGAGKAWALTPLPAAARAKGANKCARACINVPLGKSEVELQGRTVGEQCEAWLRIHLAVI